MWLGNVPKNSHRHEKFPWLSQSPSGNFLRRRNFFEPDDPNQVVRFEEISHKSKFPCAKLGPKPQCSSPRDFLYHIRQRGHISTHRAAAAGPPSHKRRRGCGCTNAGMAEQDGEATSYRTAASVIWPWPRRARMICPSDRHHGYF